MKPYKLNMGKLDKKKERLASRGFPYCCENLESVGDLNFYHKERPIIVIR